MKLLFPFVTKQASLMRRSTVLSLSLKLVLPGRGRAQKIVKDLAQKKAATK